MEFELSWTPSYSFLLVIHPALPQALPQNFRRSKEGNALVRQEMERLLKLHEEMFPNSPLLDENMCLRVKNGMGKKWDELLEEGPEALSIRFAKVRSREEFGKQLHAYFRLMTNQMKKTPPDRKEFRDFILSVNICCPGVAGAGM